MKLTADYSLQTWIDWLLSNHSEEIDLGLDRVRQVAKKMGLLKLSPYVISVAGTNGKGSSVAMLSAIYQAAGYQVGCYTSPHILTFNERFQINGQMVSDVDITRAFFEIETARKQTNGIKLTYFEFSTLAALVIFARQTLDIVILEVGLGGRLDAVNIIDADASLITAIDIDHVEWLGDNREKIGFEKAGIMRKNQLSICSDPNTPSSIKEFAKYQEVDFYQLNKDYSLKIKDASWNFIAANTRFHSYETLPFPNLQGEFQIQNAAGVIALIQAGKHIVTQRHIVDGLQNISHAGRLQSFEVNQNNWLADVAHNVQSMAVLAEYLEQQNFKGIAIFSVLDDKDYLNMIAKISAFVTVWYIADLSVPRASSLKSIKNMLLDSGVESSSIKSFMSIAEATEYALQQNNENVLVSGSFFTVAECYNSLQQHGIQIVG